MSATLFQDRLAPFAEVVSEHETPRLTPPRAGELAEADKYVEEQVEALRVELAGPSLEELHALGRRVAAGEIKPATVRSKIGYAGALQPPVTSTRWDQGTGYSVPHTVAGHSHMALVLAAARAEYQRQADKPELALSALKKETLPLLADHMQAVAKALIDSWEGLPEHIQQQWRERYSRDLRAIARGLDIETISGVELEARRKAAAAWGGLDFFMPGKWIEFCYGQDCALDTEDLLLPVEGVALRAAGYTISDLVVLGLIDEFEPISDPFGEDREEYEDRIQARREVRGWRFAFDDLKELGVVISGGSDATSAMRRRKDLSPARVVAAMREEGVWLW